MQRQTLRNLGVTNICRSVEPSPRPTKECGSVVGTVEPPPNYTVSKKPPSPKSTTTFVDTLPPSIEQPDPAAFAAYAVEVLNDDKRGAGLSNRARVPLLPTVPPFPYFAAEVVRQGVRISWQCPATPMGTPGMKYLFRIYRRADDNAATNKLADLNATECVAGQELLQGQPSSITALAKPVNSFLDETIQWETTYSYRGTVVTVGAVTGKPPLEIEGNDTSEVKVFAHNVFPPPVPAGLEAVFSGPGQPLFVDLIWEPVLDADLAGYNVYRREEGTALVELNAQPVKTPAFRDTQIISGRTYFYCVSAVNKQGNESVPSGEASERVP